MSYTEKLPYTARNEKEEESKRRREDGRRGHSDRGDKVSRRCRLFPDTEAR
jgi:hypothetical protein